MVAHNGVGFDRHVWARLGWPPPARVVDTAELARVAGYPEASLEWLGANLCGQPKDLEGNKLTVGLSRVSRAKKTFGQLPPVTPEILARVVQYCRRDVELMVRLYREHLSQWLDSDVEGLEAADRAVIDRGICFDRELAEMLLDADECLRDAALEAAGVESTAELAPAQLKNTLLGLGVTVDDCTADTIEALLEECKTMSSFDADVERIAALCTARQALSSIAAGKLRAGLLRCSPDGRLRDNTRYYGAHTGRWSGSGMQLQNMAAGADIDVEATIELLKQGRLEAVYLKEEKT
jgi:DNA polymerase